MLCQNQRWLKATIFPVGYSTLGSPMEVEVTNRTLSPMEHLGHGGSHGRFMCVWSVKFDQRMLLVKESRSIGHPN